MLISLKSQFEIDYESSKVEVAQNEEYIKEVMESLKGNMADMGIVGISDPVVRLALQKVNMNMEEAIMMFFDEDKVNDL